MFFVCFCCYVANRPFQPVRLPSSADGIICTFYDDRRFVIGQGRKDASESSEDEDWPTEAEEG